MLVLRGATPMTFVPTPGIRPSPDNLRELPTLKVDKFENATQNFRELAKNFDVEPILELKWKTPNQEFWLCTQGLPEPTEGAPDHWIVGYVTIYFPDGESVCYGPDDVRRLQKLDYANRIRTEMFQLADMYEDNPIDETWSKLQAAREEFEKVIGYETLPPEVIARLIAKKEDKNPPE
jgi:hypothetical protein